ncbi:hypothetical protein [Pedobacter steynii]|uniref:Uncharacterized protein n=1 Tax=Pedobacter steynii TaxID=430522 RepID=A0A1D7QKE2_9SPHI|nr:hypothetical protein [Pedobacter steynii]AOM79152.1 hypothetical protein BFS30_19445 [Pedobacter steynii]
MGQLIKKKPLAVNDILNGVNSEKTYFVYTSKGIRTMKVIVFLLLTFIIGNQFLQRKAGVLKLQPVAELKGTLLFGRPLKNVDILSPGNITPFMKNKQEAELKIKGYISKVNANGQMEMNLSDGKILKVHHKPALGDSGSLLSKEVVMAGRLYKIGDTPDLAYEVNSLLIL